MYKLNGFLSFLNLGYVSCATKMPKQSLKPNCIRIPQFLNNFTDYY
jgi:hypothetical protein